MLGNPLLLSDDGYNISRSVRLRSSASAYLDRTFTTPTSRRIFTLSAWAKRGALGGTAAILGNAGTREVVGFFGSTSGNGDALHFRDTTGGAYEVTTTAVFRDPSAWYHIVVAFDTTQATASNRVKMYVNGVQQTAFAVATYPSQNTDLNLNSAVVHAIGRRGDAAAYNLDGYLTEINFIDGQALTPSSFGETDAITGVWKPKKYGGTYGTNGFYLNFSDNSNNTAATIGKDYSGNGNNWTPNNISVTSGVTYDSMLDVPTPYADGGNGRGNYCVINPLDVQNASSVAQGNQYISFSAVNYGHSRCTMAAFDSSYWEVVAGGTNYLTLGVANSTAFSSFNWAGCWAIYQSDGKVYNNAAAITGVLATFTTNDVIGFAVKGNKLYIAKNGTWLNSGDPVAGTGSVASSLSSEVFPYIGNGGGAAGTPSAYFNAGQRPFAYTPPTGFKALNTQNLPAPSILKGNQYFDAVTYSGNGGNQSITTQFAPDFAWFKSRSNTYLHALVDKLRSGVDGLLVLYSNNTNAEATGFGSIGSFSSSGFDFVYNSNFASTSHNRSSDTDVAWLWKESATAGFDIVTFTNPSSGSSSFAHNLGVKPSMIIVKSRSNTSNWTTAHKSLGTNMADKWINLESTAAAQTSTNIWGGEPTSSVFYCGTGIQVAGATMVAYLFAEVAGFSRFGSYTGNGSTDGPFVFCGFRPRWILFKRTDSTSSWSVFDTARNTFNLTNAYFQANASDAESVFSDIYIDILSNGFKNRGANNSLNVSGGTYIFAAFAEHPFKNSLAR
jgi:hypothetical protein